MGGEGMRGKVGCCGELTEWRESVWCVCVCVRACVNLWVERDHLSIVIHSSLSCRRHRKALIRLC